MEAFSYFSLLEFSDFDALTLVIGNTFTPCACKKSVI
jgi:hypothetical protein